MEPPPTAGPSLPVSLPVSLATSLLSTFTTFLTLTLHTLVYHRGLYPRTTFLTARAYNLPVHQSRHPGLCTWISDAVAAVAAQLQTGAVRRIAVVMHKPKSLEVLERWVFDVEGFPAWGDGNVEETEEEEEEEAGVEEDSENEEVAEEEEESLNWTDVHEALRGALRRIAHAAEGLPDLPQGSTFTLAVELRDEAPVPIGHPQPWISSQTNLQPPTAASPKRGSSLGGKNTMPLRSVQAGPLFFECWVEQGPSSSQPSTKTSQSRSQTTANNSVKQSS